MIITGKIQTFSQTTPTGRIYTEGMFMEQIRYLRYWIRKDKMGKILNKI